MKSSYRTFKDYWVDLTLDTINARNKDAQTEQDMIDWLDQLRPLAEITWQTAFDSRAEFEAYLHNIKWTKENKGLGKICYINEDGKIVAIEQIGFGLFVILE